MTAAAPLSPSMWFLIVGGAVLASAAVVLAVREVARDGYGTGRPPRSHHPDAFEPRRLMPVIAVPAGLRIGARLVAGLALYGAAIALILRARLGVSPWDVLAQGIAHRSGLPFGLVTNLVGALLLALWWPLRQRPGIGTIANVLLVGTAAQVVLDVLPVLDPLPLRIGLFTAGLLLLAVATGLYVGAGLGAGPRDGLMLGVHRRFGLPIWLARSLIEGTVLIVGWVLGGDVGIGTVVFAAVIGPLCGITIPLLGLHRPPRAPAGPGRYRGRRAHLAVDHGRAA